MGENKRKPDIRFQGFTDDWEQRKAFELAEYSKGSGYSKRDLVETGTPIILYGRLYTNYQFSIVEVDTFVNPKNGSVFSQGNEVIVPASGETAEDIARASAVEKSGILIGGDLNIIRPYNCINPQYLALTLSSGKAQKELSKKAQGKSVVHIRSSDIQRVTISYPSRTEQEQIIKVFRGLDHLITLHQRKYTKLINVKKSMLGKMFPRDGAKVPEIRFEGFIGDWEQRKVSDVAEIIGGGTPSTNNSEYWDGDIDWYSPAEIGEQIYVNGSERKITKFGLEKSSAKILPAGRTVLFTSRAGIGKTAILRRSGATNQGFQSMVLNDDINPYFVFSMTNMIKDKAERVAAGSTFAEISGKMLGNLEFMFPSKEEQDKIGSYFEQIDHLIIHHQRKLKKLKNIKKSMLEKMFI